MSIHSPIACCVRGEDLELQVGSYGNGATALVLFSPLEGPYGKLTVNLGDASAMLPANEVSVKTWEENAPMRQLLEQEGQPLFKDTGLRVPAGHCMAEIWCIVSPQLQAEVDAVRAQRNVSEARAAPRRPAP